MTSIDERLHGASDQLDRVATPAVPRRIEQLERRAAHRNLRADASKGIAVIALVIAPVAGWQLLSGGDSIGGPSSEVPTTSPSTTDTTGTATATSIVQSLPTVAPGSESSNPPESDPEGDVPAPKGPNPFASVSHDQVQQIITSALASNGIDTVGAEYSAKGTDPFDGRLTLPSVVDGSSVEVSVSGWFDGSMPTDPEAMGEFISSACPGVETPHGWVFLDDSDGGSRQAAVVSPSANVIVVENGGDTALETLQAVAQDVADQLGASTGRPYAPTPNARAANVGDACESVPVLATDISRQQVEEVFADVLIANDLPFTDYSLEPYQDSMMFDAYTDVPEQASVGINALAYRVNANDAVMSEDELPAPGTADVRRNGDDERSATAFAGTTVVDVSSAAALNGDDVSDELLATVALELAKRLDSLEW